MMYKYELEKVGTGISINSEFREGLRIKRVAEYLLEQMMEIRFNEDGMTAISGPSILRNLTTNESWDINSEEYVKISYHSEVTSIDKK